MGFSNFWSIFQHPDIFFGRPLPTRQLHYSASSASNGSRQPYLLIDYNNVFMKASLHDFGNVLINDVFIDRLWNAILSSGFKIRIIFDGAHNPDRALVKLMRMHGTISKALRTTALEASTFDNMEFDASLQVAKSTYNSLLAAYEEQKIDIKCITAEQEADTLIRRMCRKLVGSRESVCIFSGDASLILGVPSAVYILSPDRFLINEAGKIEGPCLTVSSVLAALNAFIFANYRFLNPTGCKLDSESLCLVASLLGGEEVRSTVDPACSPYQIVDTVSTFLFQRRVMVQSDPWFSSNPRLLVSACVLVLAWRQHLTNCNDVFPHEVPNPVRYVSYLSSLLLGVTEALNDAVRGNTSPRIFSIPKLNPDGIYKLSTGILSQINKVGVIRLIAKRLDEIMDLSSVAKGSPIVLYKSIWPVYTSSYEPVGEDTEETLRPFVSYVKQLSRLHASSAQKVASINEPILTTDYISAEAFNTWMGTQHPSSRTKMTSSESISYRCWKASIIQKSSKVLDRFDAHSLSTSILNSGTFPASGSIAADAFGRVLAWEVRPDAQSFQDDLCDPTYRWESSGGPVVDLRVRYLTLRSGAVGLLDWFGVNVGLGQQLLGSLTSFWTTAYQMKSRRGMHPSVDSLVAAPDVGATTIVVLLQVIASCWFPKLIKVADDGAEKLKAFIADALVEALALSPLFALGLFCRVKDSLSDIHTTTQCIHAWYNRWNHLLVLSKNSLSSAPVGSLEDARWTEVVDLILGKLVDHVPAALSHLGNMIAFAGWFDANGVCTALRLKSATNKNVLEVDAMRKELGFSSDCSALMEQIMTIKGSCRLLLDDLMSSFRASQMYGNRRENSRPTERNSNSMPDLSLQMQRLRMDA